MPSPGWFTWGHAGEAGPQEPDGRLDDGRGGDAVFKGCGGKMTGPESAGPAISQGRAGSSGQVGWPGQALLTLTATGHRPPDGRGHGFVRGLLHQRLHGAGAGAAAGAGGGLGGTRCQHRPVCCLQEGCARTRGCSHLVPFHRLVAYLPADRGLHQPGDQLGDVVLVLRRALLGWGSREP